MLEERQMKKELCIREKIIQKRKCFLPKPRTCTNYNVVIVMETLQLYSIKNREEFY